jgi:hypothetical protein
MSQASEVGQEQAAALRIERDGAEPTLVVRSAHPHHLDLFDGQVAPGPDGPTVRGPLSRRNADAARRVLPNLRPRPIGLHTSAGTGDRLGLATPGHVRAFRESGKGVRPVFAQQSIREMDRLGRTPQDVLDDATFGCIAAGWDGPVGADADHLKTTADIDRCLAAGFSLYTIDVGDFVNPHAGAPSEADLAALPWAGLEDDLAGARRRYAGRSVDVGDRGITVGERDLAHAMAKYGAAIATGVSMYRHLMAHASTGVEVEIAVDETDEPTTPAEHVYIATELARLGVEWVSFAPRHLGTFEKGVEFVGDRDALFDSIRLHAGIARTLGPYKIGMHSGSDKFSIYAGLMEHTDGMVHLKTSGTSYLVALGVLATAAPELLHQAYALSFDVYRDARASYQVSADFATVPAPREVSDDGLMALLTNPATRQILHVGYGAVLRTPERGPSELGLEIRSALEAHRDEYSADLATHLGRHLAPLASLR